MEAVEQAAEASGVVVMEALMYRFHPQTERVRELILSGAIGDVQLISAAFTYHVPNAKDIRYSDALGGGVLLDVGTYCVSISRLAAQSEPISIYGSARIGPGSDVDEVFVGALGFPGGIHAAFTCALYSPRDQWYRITGTTGTLIVPVPFAPGTDNRTLLIRRGWQRGKETEERIEIPGADQYQLLVEHFVERVRNQRETPLTLAETRANVTVLEALRNSARA
jgi:predicted dehydrogenase